MGDALAKVAAIQARFGQGFAGFGGEALQAGFAPLAGAQEQVAVRIGFEALRKGIGRQGSGAENLDGEVFYFGFCWGRGTGDERAGEENACLLYTSDAADE